MAVLRDLAGDRTELSAENVERLEALVREWSLIADLSMSDLVLWAPTWNEGGMVALAQVRPNTAPTTIADDLVGGFLPRGREPEVDQALALGRIVGAAYPVRLNGPEVMAVVVRRGSQQSRVAGRLEEVYRQTADDLLRMLVEGTFPAPEVLDAASDAPRVGDGLIRADEHGRVVFASPNAVSALRRLGLATEVLGAEFHPLVMRLAHRPGPLEEALSRVSSGRVEGRAEIDNAAASVAVHGIPLKHSGKSAGTLFLLCDVTEVRRRERALVSKDATIREIHHRVKNNLQTVAALLRLQGRRAAGEEVRSALGEAERRVASIAVVHELLSEAGGSGVPFDQIVDRLIGLVTELVHPDRSIRVQRRGYLGALSTEQSTAMAMILSELLQNALEHSGADRIEVVLAQSADSESMTVIDDGAGMAGGASKGLGLQIVESLATGELAGRIEVRSAEPRGTEIEVVVPRARV